MFRLARPLLATSLIATLLATTTGTVLPAAARSEPLRLAQAGPSPDRAPMDVNVFYDQLGAYGSWVEHPDYQYVFIPANVGPGWRPYQEGRWIWTDQYGWYWESYEPFGWAAYHYGRWGYDPGYGWFWVPGDTWAPAWVTWRRGGGRTGWAPVGPDRPGYAVGRPTYYAPPVAESWVFVEDRYMAEEDLAVYVAPIPQISVYLQDAPDYYEPRWGDGYYVNRGFGLDVYDAPIRDRLYTREVVYVDRYDDIFYDDRDERLGIYAPRLAFGDRFVPPPRFDRDIAPDRRALIHQYVRDDQNLPGVFAPSAALLGAIDANRRRELRQERFRDPNRFRQQVEQIERERADQLRDLRQQAATRNDLLEQQRRQTMEQRRQQFERVRAEQRARAERVNTRPGGQPGMPGVRPGQLPNDMRANQQQLERQQQLQQQRNVQRERAIQQQQVRQQAEQQRAVEQQRARQQQMQQQRNVQQERAIQQQQMRQQAQQQRAVEQQRARQQQMQLQRNVQQERAVQQQQMRQQAQQQRAQQQQMLMQQRAAQQQQRAQQRPPQQQRPQGQPGDPRDPRWLQPGMQ